MQEGVREGARENVSCFRHIGSSPSRGAREARGECAYRWSSPWSGRYCFINSISLPIATSAAAFCWWDFSRHSGSLLHL